MVTLRTLSWGDYLDDPSDSEVLVAQLFATRWTVSPPGFSVHGILQARILEWLLFLSPGDLPGPGIEPTSPELQADSLPSEPPGKPTGAL